MQMKKKLSLVLALVLAAQLCLPVGGVVTDKPIADPVTGEIISTDGNPEAEIPMVPAEPEVPATPEAPDLDAPAEEMAVDVRTIDIGTDNWYILIEQDGYTIGPNAKAYYTGSYVLTGYTKSTNAAFDHIKVNNTGSTPIQITLRDTKIEFDSYKFQQKCAFAIENGAVELTLEGTNILKSGNYKAGIQLTKKAGSLTITKESTGSLTATGGFASAGIGGEGAITISGGMVTANGASWDDAGIGNASSSGYGSSFSTGADGNAVIFASSISDQRQKRNWSGMIFEKKEGAIYGSGFTLGGDMTIPEGSAVVSGVSFCLSKHFRGREGR